MVIAKIKVDGVTAVATELSQIPKGIQGATIEVTYAGAWESMNKTAVFSGSVVKDVVNVGAVISVPPETVAKSGHRLRVGFYGVDGENKMIIPTLWVDLGAIQSAADPSGDASTNPSLPVWAQLQAEVETLKETGGGTGTGATAEQAAQITQNKEDIEKLSREKLDASKLPEAVQEIVDEFGAVSYNKQTLTEEQKAQARENIGAASAEKVNSISNDISEITERTISVNLFNMNSAQIKHGYLVNSAGAYIASSGSSVSHPILAEKGTTYTFKTRLGHFGNSGLLVMPCDYNGSLYDGEYIKPSANTKATDNGDGTATFVIADGWPTTHFVVNMYTTTVDTFMVVKGTSMPETYAPYEEGSLKIKRTLASPLVGKKMSLNGDSICYGAGSTGGYGKMIAATYGMTLQNLAKNGATITADVYHEDGTARHWISRTISEMDTDSDYIIVEGGVNDSSLSAPLGSLSDGYNSTLDDATFYGAFESMLKQLLIRFAGKKVGYIAVHKMSNNFQASNEKETSYYWAAKLCCEKWGVPFLDLNVSVPPFGLIQASNTEMYPLREAYTYNADGWHPNEEGYKKYYVPKIVAWMETL